MVTPSMVSESKANSLLSRHFRCLSAVTKLQHTPAFPSPSFSCCDYQVESFPRQGQLTVEVVLEILKVSPHEAERVEAGQIQMDDSFMSVFFCHVRLPDMMKYHVELHTICSKMLSKSWKYWLFHWSMLPAGHPWSCPNNPVCFQLMSQGHPSVFDRAGVVSIRWVPARLQSVHKEMLKFDRFLKRNSGCRSCRKTKSSSLQRLSKNHRCELM